jgi:hypothetical protein
MIIESKPMPHFSDEHLEGVVRIATEIKSDIVGLLMQKQ